MVKNAKPPHNNR